MEKPSAVTTSHETGALLGRLGVRPLREDFSPGRGVTLELKGRRTGKSAARFEPLDKSKPHVRALGPGRFEGVDPTMADLPADDVRRKLAGVARSPVLETVAALNFARVSSPDAAKRAVVCWELIRKAAGSPEGTARLAALGVQTRQVVSYETHEGFASLDVLRHPEDLLRDVATHIGRQLAEHRDRGRPLSAPDHEIAERALSEAFGGADVASFMAALLPALKLRTVANKRKADRRARRGK